jgi:tRNA U55 pseudouridine synthase TruB
MAYTPKLNRGQQERRDAAIARAARVVEMREQGMKWWEIAALINMQDDGNDEEGEIVSRQRAHQIYTHEMARRRAEGG